MTEFELKLQIPPGQAAQVEGALRRGRVEAQRLQAQYFDTADGRLAMHGIALRLRKEGRRWVQTLKAAGAGPLERLEHNVALPAGTPAVPELALHRGTPAAECLAEALKDAPAEAPLELVVRTDIRRLTRVVKTGRSSVEVALDRGSIVAGPRKHAVCEIEFELKQGDPHAAVALAAQWCQRHGLWLDVVSKAQRGHLLSQGLVAPAPAHAGTPKFPREADAAQAAQAVLSECLHQALANGSAVAAGTAGDEHIHQARVGLRRLRTALRALGPLFGAIDPAWEATLAETFRTLGAHRDFSHLAPMLQRQMEAAGAPPLLWESAGDPPDPAAAWRAPDFQRVLLALLGLVHGEAAAGDGRSLRKHADDRFARLFRQVRKDARRFEALSDEEHHRLRKRFKRLRYLAELLQPLYGGRRTASFIAALKPVQQALGDYQDVLVALPLWNERAAAEPRAWFGAGWLQARRAAQVEACRAACKRFVKEAQPFWD